METVTKLWDRAWPDFKIGDRKDNAWKAVGNEFAIPALVAE